MVAASQAGREDRILTLPNGVTVVRLLCVPVFVWLLLGKEPPDRYDAALLLALLGATDWVDGYLARHLGQVSTLGKVLDPVADRVLIGVAAVAILIDGSVPRWFAVAVLAREGLVAAATIVLALAGARRIDVQWIGKAGTFGLMVTFPLFLIGHSTVSWHWLAELAAWGWGIPSLIFAWYAAITYIPIARRALVDGRGARKLPERATPAAVSRPGQEPRS